ncbi:MAG: acetyl-CoA carboxylase biotin carboxyl carrier protein [Bacteroidia bacterium]|nr:acetyl-CoA carboxylase biotin carboxyl carrier protein [Bacteroidia bacterium]
MKLSEIQDLIKFVSKSGVSEVELETKEIKITIKTGKSQQSNTTPVVIQQPTPVQSVPVQQQVVQAPVQQHVPSVEAPKTQEKQSSGNNVQTSAGSDESKYVTIKSPMIGTFYRSPSPDKPPFVNVGDEIKQGQTVCIIEAMKLFNEIESDVSGRIVKVLVDNATPVEYDQPLFLVDPS